MCLELQQELLATEPMSGSGELLWLRSFDDAEDRTRATVRKTLLIQELAVAVANSRALKTSCFNVRPAVLVCLCPCRVYYAVFCHCCSRASAEAMGCDGVCDTLEASPEWRTESAQ